MQGSTSKYRNVYGDLHKDKFEDAKPAAVTTEGSLLDVNGNFIALSWLSSGGGALAIIDCNNPHRLKHTCPLITGHTAPICEVKFSPFKSNLLATASDDATVRLWNIPQEGLTENINTEIQKFSLHGKKVNFINFHPGVAEVIASAGADCDVYAWNILNADSYCKIHLGDIPSCIDWNHTGSLLGTATKEKLAYILDPRAAKIVLTAKAHDSSKIQKMQFLDENYFYTAGFSKNNERQLKLFDLRHVNNDVLEASSQTTVDRQSGIVMPFYDSDLGLIYLPGRGEGNINIFEFANGTIKYATDYKSGEPQKGIAWLPKRLMNYNKCEISRCAKLTSNSIEYISFYIPRRNEGYDPAVYPDCLYEEPCMTVDEWIGGENKEPLRKPITSLENKWITADMTFEKKVEEVKEEKSPEDKIRVLEAELVELTAENELLKKKLAESETMIESLNTKFQQLQEEIKECKTK